MNDDTTEFERELRRLKPLRPSVSLENRLSECLDVHGESSTPLPWYQRLGFTRPLAALAWTVATPVTAVLVVMAFTAAPPPANEIRKPGDRVAAIDQNTVGHPGTIPPVAGPARFEPAVASNVLYQASDEGVVLDNTHAPVRRVRVRSQDTLAWRNPQTGAQWEVSYPREDVLQLPLHTQ